MRVITRSSKPQSMVLYDLKNDKFCWVSQNCRVYPFLLSCSPAPEKTNDAIEEELRVQGFKRTYKVNGSWTEKVRQIREPISPPLAKAIVYSAISMPGIYPDWDRGR